MFIRRLTPRNVLRTCKNAIFDLRYGGWSGGYQRNPAPGANGTGATDYALMSQIFRGRIFSSDVLVDVGCGKGRVINWWLDNAVTNPIYGLELLADVAADVRKRLQRFKNVTIITGDAIQHLPFDGTLFYLFNPFDRAQMCRFHDRVRMIARQRPVRIIYFGPVHADVFEADGTWKVRRFDLAIPRAGVFEDRHKHYAVITPKQALRECVGQPWN